MAQAYLFVTIVVGLAVLGSVLYLLVILAAALRRPASPAKASHHGWPNLVVLVPAHDEELVLAASLDSLLAQDYPQDCVEILVIADNCTDSTAALARARGVTVWERSDAAARGKGYALDWAIAQLLARPISADAFVVIDADTYVAPDFLSCMAARLGSAVATNQICALQGRYGVLNACDGWRASLMAAAFDLVNHVRPLGRDQLGLSVGLKGNGMAFTRSAFACVRWHGDSLTEDLEFALDLAREQNVRVAYVPEARVWAQMPANAAQATSQRRRWEEGRRHSVRTFALPLLWEGLAHRRALLIDSGLDLLLLPLAELAALMLCWLGLIAVGIGCHLLPCPTLWAAGGVLALLGLLGYVLGGLRAAGAGREAYLALLRAPFYAVWKLALRLRKTRIPSSQASDAPVWVRTERAPITTPLPTIPTSSKTEARLP